MRKNTSAQKVTLKTKPLFRSPRDWLYNRKLRISNDITENHKGLRQVWDLCHSPSCPCPYFLKCKHKMLFLRFPFTPTSKAHTSHQQRHISCSPSCLSTWHQFWDCTHFPPLHTKKNPSVCAEHITHESVTAWQVIAPNGCQHAEMWGGHCVRRSETRGE